MRGLISFGNKRNYDDFKKQIPLSTYSLFDSTRKFCLSLGENVVEDVRMHRIVFGKSMTFRWFADIQPEKEGIIIKIQRNRKSRPQIIEVNNNQDISEYSNIIKNAYEEIH